MASVGGHRPVIVPLHAACGTLAVTIAGQETVDFQGAEYSPPGLSACRRGPPTGPKPLLGKVFRSKQRELAATICAVKRLQGA